MRSLKLWSIIFFLSRRILNGFIVFKVGEKVKIIFILRLKKLNFIISKLKAIIFNIV